MKLWQRIRSCVRGIDSPRQLAAGLMLGMMIGLIPKDSLIVYGLLGVLLSIRANLIAATVGGLVSAGLATLLTPVFHSVGLFILEMNLLRPMWDTISQLPLMGWTRFNNTLVMGSFVVGLLSAFPVFRIGEKWFASYGATSYRKLRNSKIACSLIGSPQEAELTQSIESEIEPSISFHTSVTTDEHSGLRNNALKKSRTPKAAQPKLRQG